MSAHFTDRLLDAIRRKGSPAVVALDPAFGNLPAPLRDTAGARIPSPAGARIPSRTHSRESLPASAGELSAILDFSRRVIALIAPIVPAVKINSAYFECYQSAGIDAYYTLVEESLAAGLIVIGDVKRGDVGHSAEMYARAHLSDAFAARTGGRANPDAITISGYLGIDGVRPFIDVARDEGKGLFVLVRTSNPSAASLQDLPLADGRKVHDALARHVAQFAADPSLIGESGYSCVGAVAATRNSADAAALRDAMPHSLFLVPGYGVQGGRAEDFAPYFKPDHTGALIAAGRSIIFAHEDPSRRERFGDDWESCVAAACRDFAGDLADLSK